MATRPVEKNNLDNVAPPALSDLTAMSDLTPASATAMLDLGDAGEVASCGFSHGAGREADCAFLREAIVPHEADL